MASNIVLLPLSLWTQDHIRAIYQATTQSATEAAIDAFLSKEVEITINGTKISRTDFVNQVKSEKFLEAGAIVAFAGTVQVPSDKKAPVLAGSVGVFYTATIAEEIRIRDAPEESIVTASTNVVIEQDLDIPVPANPLGLRGGGFDRRRVKVLNQVFTDAPVPFNLNPTA